MPFSLTLAVADLQRTALFYREILEWEVEEVVPLPGRPAVLLLRRGATVLFFREMSALEALHPALFQNLERRPRGIGISLEFTVADLRPIRRAIERRRLHTLYELEDEEFGRREIWLHDPDGYLLVLQQET
ncbi:MAG: VOC family protein [Desulfuromonadales bacterium]